MHLSYFLGLECFEGEKARLRDAKRLVFSNIDEEGVQFVKSTLAEVLPEVYKKKIMTVSLERVWERVKQLVLTIPDSCFKGNESTVLKLVFFVSMWYFNVFFRLDITMKFEGDFLKCVKRIAEDDRDEEKVSEEIMAHPSTPEPFAGSKHAMFLICKNFPTMITGDVSN